MNMGSSRGGCPYDSQYICPVVDAVTAAEKRMLFMTSLSLGTILSITAAIVGERKRKALCIMQQG